MGLCRDGARLSLWCGTKCSLPLYSACATIEHNLYKAQHSHTLTNTPNTDGTTTARLTMIEANNRPNRVERDRERWELY
jgi:hypothetical protein